MVGMSNSKKLGYESMKEDMKMKGSIVSSLVEWGKKNSVFVSDYVDLLNREEVKKFIDNLKKDKLWE